MDLFQDTEYPILICNQSEARGNIASVSTKLSG